mgnify:CR=1 FL=1
MLSDFYTCIKSLNINNTKIYHIPSTYVQLKILKCYNICIKIIHQFQRFFKFILTNVEQEPYN